MNRKTKWVVASVPCVVLGSALAYYLQLPSRDPLGDELMSFGYREIKPPSMLVEVGSLYHVSDDGRDYTEICPADRNDIEAVVKKSASFEIEQNLNQHGSFASDISVASLFEGGVSNGYDQKVHFSLRDITLEEVPLEFNFQIQAKLISNANCNNAVQQMLSSSGYVCQGQKTLLATAEYDLDRDSRNKLKAGVAAAPEKVNEALKVAIKTQSDQSVVEKNGRLYSGSALNYGVEMNPTCLTPAHANFARILPRTSFDRFLNFVRYRVIEPWLPPTSDLPAPVVQAAGAEMK